MSDSEGFAPLGKGEANEAAVAAILVRFLLHDVDLAEGWAEVICESRAAPVPGDVAVPLPPKPSGKPRRPGPLTGEGYSMREVERAAKRYASELTTGQYPALGSLMDALRRARKAWARQREDELQQQAKASRALPAETTATERARLQRERAARQAAMSEILGSLGVSRLELPTNMED